MNIRKVAWSTSKQNEIIYYYALEPQGSNKTPTVLESPIPMSSDVARGEINKQNLKKGIPMFDGEILSVQLDLSSGFIYLPEITHVGQVRNNPLKDMMLDAVRLKATNKYGSLPGTPPIVGDPFKLIRVRSITDFPSGSEFIKAHLQEETTSGEFVNIPVIEANLSEMIPTLEQLPSFKENIKRQGQAITKKMADTITFAVREGQGGSTTTRDIYMQKTPFILINTSKESNIGEADKERIVITGYKEFSTEGVTPGIINSAGKYTVKYLLYMGYSFEDMCQIMLGEQDVDNFGDLITKGSHLLNAAKELTKTGYRDPANSPTYYSFKIDETFPVRFRPQMAGAAYDNSNQPDIFTVVYFDIDTDVFTFRSPLFLSDEICKKIFNAQENIVRCKYDPFEKCIKTDLPPSALIHASSITSEIIKKEITDRTDLPEGVTGLEFKEKNPLEARFTKRTIKDYYQAADRLEKICDKLSSKERKVEFNDLPVVVGPWEATMGFAGGYTNMKKIKEQGAEVPMKLFPGSDWALMPPFIMIDNGSNPSVADQAHIVVHEYRHHINEQIGVESPDYDMASKPKNWEEQVRQRLEYLASPDEKEAHIQQMMYLIGSGLTTGQLLNIFMGKQPVDSNNIRIAREYLKLIKEASSRVKQDFEEENQDKNLQDMLDSIMNEDDQDDLTNLF